MKKTRILFIHHSTGGNLIREGHLRQALKKINPSLELWDHNYNLMPILPWLFFTYTHLQGLSNSIGNYTGIDYQIVVSNNSPREYADIFSRNIEDPTLKSILTYDIIAFKNCYPTTRIISDEKLLENISYYTKIREAIKRLPEKQFILLTPPPARKETTNKDQALRARKLVSTLASLMFIHGTRNLHVFDFFSLLADHEGFLKKEYCRFLPWDSHPNNKANQTIAPLFAEYLAKIVSS